MSLNLANAIAELEADGLRILMHDRSNDFQIACDISQDTGDLCEVDYLIESAGDKAIVTVRKRGPHCHYVRVEVIAGGPDSFMGPRKVWAETAMSTHYAAPYYAMVKP
jgi:hypothetical protein